MEMFVAALIAVGTMMLYAVPGFVTVKAKMIKPDNIRGFAVVLMYFCQPCLTVTSLMNAEYSWEYFKQVLIFFSVAVLVQGMMLGVSYLILRRRGEQDVKYRVAVTATAFGNVGFMGVPLLQAIMPAEVANQAVLLSVAFLIGLNLFGWTIGCGIVSKDKKYISIKKAIFNPTMLGLVIGLPIFFTGWSMPEPLSDMVTLVGKMSTPLCMLILGMRLATMSFRSIVASPLQYIIVGVKQIVMPLIAMLIIWFMPLDLFVRQTMFVLAAAPVASIVLNFAELLGEGQESAANMVLLGTLSSVITIPLLTLLMNVLPV